MSIDRRVLLGSALALAACDRRADAQTAPAGVPPLRSVAPFPIGCCLRAEQLDDPAFVPLLAAQVSQITPEWEMKMEYIVQDDGSFRFDAPDRIAAFAQGNGMKLFGHTLVWYDQKPPAFERLDTGRVKFAEAYRNYILAVVGRYRDQVSGWDVVNEAVAEDGVGWRDHMWSQRLGKLEHMVLAFQHAREADPHAVLFINDYNLENLPRKRATFMKLVEALLKAGAPLGGVGTQTHVAADLAPGEITKTIKELASFGLPIHLSEMDVSLSRAAGGIKDRPKLEAGQARVYAEAAEAFSSLPDAQQFAFSHWGLRDKDSWLKREDVADTPLMFDDDGRPKAAAAAFVRGLS